MGLGVRGAGGLSCWGRGKGRRGRGVGRRVGGGGEERREERGGRERRERRAGLVVEVAWEKKGWLADSRRTGVG